MGTSKLDGLTGDSVMSQWRMEPSEPPVTRSGWTGCQASASCGLSQR